MPAAALRPATWAPPYRPYEPRPSTTGRPQHLLRGTPLATPGGREVAVTADVVEVEAPAGGAACFDARLALGRGEDTSQSSIPRPVRLCASAAHVIGAPPPPSRTASTRPDGAPEDVARPPRGARRTPRGVWYRVLTPGKGDRRPTATDSVKVHYTGWTTDGVMFDSSLTRGAPAIFSLTSVIPGWTDGLAVMTVGMKARLWIPEELAYKGAPGRPAGMLVFDVELLEIR